MSRNEWDRERRRRERWERSERVRRDAWSTDRALRDFERRVGRRRFETEMGGDRRSVLRQYREERRRSEWGDARRTWADDVAEWMVAGVRRLRRAWGESSGGGWTRAD